MLINIYASNWCLSGTEFHYELLSSSPQKEKLHGAAPDKEKKEVSYCLLYLEDNLFLVDL